MFFVDTVDISEGENPQSVRPNRGSPRYGPMPRPNRPSSYSPTSQVVHLPFGAGLLHCRSSISMSIFLHFYRLLLVMSLCLINCRSFNIFAIKDPQLNFSGTAQKHRMIQGC